MFPWLSRNLILPLHEKLLGRRTFPLLGELQRNVLTPERLADIQRERLKSLFQHCRQNIPWWRSRLRDAPEGDDITDPRAALSGIPILKRSEIKESLEEIRWRNPPVKVIKHTSSGTTDDNLLFYCGRERQTWNRAMRQRALARVGFRAGDPVVHLWPDFPEDSFAERLKASLRTFRNWMVDDREFDLRPFDPPHFETAQRAIFRYPRCVIFSYPSWVARLLDYWNRSRPGLPFHPNCVVYCSGEVLHEAQRRYFREEFNVPVYEEYGSQETGAIANEDEHHILRLNAEHILVEILRDGQPVAPGELGEVVVTNLTATLMPFIRYATGDVARQPEHPEFPMEGDRLPRFPKVEGRTSDLLISAKTQLLPSRPLVDALMTVVNLRWFHLHQSSQMELEIHTLTRDQSKRDAAERVVANYLGRDLRIGWRTGDAFSPLRSGKHRYVCSPPAARLIAHDKRIDDELARAWPQPVVTSRPN